MEEQYYCEPCASHFNDKHNYERHLSRLTHLKNIAISVEHMHCSICNYTAKRMTHFNNHLQTKKHIKADIEYTNNLSKYNCSKCNFYANSKAEYLSHANTKKHKDTEMLCIQQPEYVNANLFIQLMQENAQFQQTLVEFCIKQNAEMCKTIIENVQHQNTITNQSHNTNSHNTQNFNINIFLNETCKDAININEFIESLKIDSDVIEHIGREGYVEGMTKIFFDGLGQMQVQRRPIHCTDVKREIFYIRDDNEWLKDQDNKRIESAINRIVRKNQSNLHLWREKNPQYDTMNTPEYEFYIEIMKQCIGGGQEKEVINNRKIIRNLAKFTAVDKSLTI